MVGCLGIGIGIVIVIVIGIVVGIGSISFKRQAGWGGWVGSRWPASCK